MFKKTKKIAVFLIVFILLISVFSFSASAETKYKTSFIKITKAKMMDYSGGPDSPVYELPAVTRPSPTGGTSQGFNFGSNEMKCNGVQGNMYFDYINFEANKKYVLSFKFFLTKRMLYYQDQIDMFDFYFNLCDSNRQYRLRMINTNDISYREDKNWTIGNAFSNSVTNDFAFFNINVSFVPSQSFKGHYFNFGFALFNLKQMYGYFGLSDLTLSYEVDGNQSIIDNQNQNTQDIIDNQNDNTDKQIQADKELYEKEKQEIDSSGNDSIDGVTESIPDDSEGFISAINKLSSCLVSRGHKAVWDFPRVYLPQIPNVFDKEVELISSTRINFNFWINKIPSTIMTIVRTLFTLALLIFCFKELYSIISYVMTLKKGE